jgi:hypothetical protein
VVLPPKTDALPVQACWGLPLLAACSPENKSNALDEIARLVYWLGLPEFEPHHRAFRLLLAEALAAELGLWIEAARYHGPSPRIPYAFQFLALEWFWTPEAHAKDLRAPALCLRCGAMWFPYRKIKSPPRCEHCSSEEAKAREWPAHAVAPDVRGKWWLRCQAEGCKAVFVGRRNQLRCEQCDSSRRTASKRSPLRPSKR